MYTSVNICKHRYTSVISKRKKMRFFGIHTNFLLRFLRLIRYTDVYGCIWMYMDVYGCIRMYTDVYGCIRMYTDVYKCLQMFYKCLQMFTYGYTSVYVCLRMQTSKCVYFGRTIRCYTKVRLFWKNNSVFI